MSEEIVAGILGGDTTVSEVENRHRGVTDEVALWSRVIPGERLRGVIV